VDGAGSRLPPPDSTHQDESDHMQMARAIEEASTLPLLPSGISGLSPKEESPLVSYTTVSSPGKSPLRSPRRMTLRQSDVSPSLLSNRNPLDEEVAPLSLTSSSPSDPLLTGITTGPGHGVQFPSSEPEVEEMEEVDLSTGPDVSSD
jgi:hypothetical protein